MNTQVYTETICDRCSQSDRREGAEGSVPPVGWAQLDIAYRVAGTGWSGGGRRVTAVLCPACARVVEQAAAQGGNPGEG